MSKVQGRELWKVTYEDARTEMQHTYYAATGGRLGSDMVEEAGRLVLAHCVSSPHAAIVRAVEYVGSVAIAVETS